MGEELGLLPHLEGRQGIAGGTAGIAHPAAVDHGQIGGHVTHHTLEIVKHRRKLLSLFLVQTRGMGPGMAEGHRHRVGGVIGLGDGRQL